MTEGQSRPFHRQLHCRKAATLAAKPRRLLLLAGLFAIGLLLTGLKADAASPITADSPIGFFTNVAARLLRSELGLDLTNIQVYPTNQYTPAVHRLLQVAANIYDCTTNRDYNGVGYPYLPTIFRPLYRRTIIGNSDVVLINGYREVAGTAIIAPDTGAPEVELDSNPSNVKFIPPLGTAPGIDRTEPLVSGFPLVVGAKTGLPNFNEFAMQTYIYVSRLLEFRRDVTDGPVRHTNQMYIAAITNAFGLEAWNSYSNIYPRNLQMIVRADMTAILTNELGNLLVSNRVTEATNILWGPWPGWTNANAMQASFALPWSTTNSCIFLPNVSYNSQFPGFIPFTHIFSAATRDTYDIPRWFLNLNTRIRFVLVDTVADRIVDYVDLNNWQSMVDINAVLTTGADCNPINYNNIGNLFCTNRQHGSFAINIPTLGILSQIAASLAAMGDPDMRSFTVDLYAGTDAHRAIDGFRYNLMGWAPHYPEDQTVTFYKSNVFYAPLAPYRPIYAHTSWPANDPLVHYTLNDVTDLTVDPTNQLNFVSDNPPLANLGFLNRRYQPWGGSPIGINPVMPPMQPAAKDPSVVRPDCWQFPANLPLSVECLGQVHRGTPWQTIFLKSTNILQSTPSLLQSLALWQKWTGNPLVRPYWGHTGLAVDAFFAVPTNDWHILNSLAPLLNTNSPASLSSPNQRSPQGWLGLLGGIQVLTNSAPGQFDTLVMSGNSPQGTNIALGLDRTRQQQPAQMFAGIGDILATPELSMASPWLNLSDPYITDEAYEMVPAQLLGKLRPDSICSLNIAGGAVQVQFTGFDPYTYAVQVSSNLTDWVSVSTNSPNNGIFNFLDLTFSNNPTRFYRSVVLP